MPQDLEYERSKVWKQNDINAEAATDYVTREGNALRRNINLTAAGQAKHSVPNSVVLITVISVSRANSQGHGTKYLTQAVAKTHRLLKEFHAASNDDFFQMAICNVDSQPMDNTEAKFLSEALHIPLMNRFAKYGLGQLESRSIFEKEKNDYAYCLNESLKHRPDYVLLLEDDAILVDNAFRTVHHILTHSFEYFFTKKQRQETAYIKLYHPMRLLSFFSYQVERIPELLALGAIFGSISLGILSRLTKVIDKIGLHRLWLFTIIYFTLFFFCIGRSNLLKVREFSNYFYQIVPAPSCCTPAMLFPNSTAHTLVKYFHQTTSRKGYAKDYILETFKQDTRFVGRMISPNLVEHIGMFSALRRKTLNPFIVN
ncbi:post-GPI attachment to proteins factor 4-like isoform X2 [Lineus longissimus]|uniref:post-GPI attachment to proteins factor 4-like isoform X2 n=1 Tax=Lineus longissimus TaxID=88925 RepID=UPI00315CF18A